MNYLPLTLISETSLSKDERTKNLGLLRRVTVTDPRPGSPKPRFPVKGTEGNRTPEAIVEETKMKRGGN